MINNNNSTATKPTTPYNLQTNKLQHPIIVHT